MQHSMNLDIASRMFRDIFILIQMVLQHCLLCCSFMLICNVYLKLVLERNNLKSPHIKFVPFSYASFKCIMELVEWGLSNNIC